MGWTEESSPASTSQSARGSLQAQGLGLGVEDSAGGVCPKEGKHQGGGPLAPAPRARSTAFVFLSQAFCLQSRLGSPG